MGGTKQAGLEMAGVFRVQHVLLPAALCPRVLSLFTRLALVALFCSYAGAHVHLLDSAQHVPDPEVPGHPGQRDVSGWQSDAGPSGDQKVRPGMGHGPRVGLEIFLSPVAPQLSE